MALGLSNEGGAAMANVYDDPMMTQGIVSPFEYVGGATSLNLIVSRRVVAEAIRTHLRSAYHVDVILETRGRGDTEFHFAVRIPGRVKKAVAQEMRGFVRGVAATFPL
jgi:hypothetical protein